MQFPCQKQGQGHGLKIPKILQTTAGKQTKLANQKARAMAEQN